MPSCPICDKVYIRQSAYQRHITVCKFIPPSAATKNEADNLPSYSEVCFLLQEALLEIVAMKQEMAIFRTILNTKKKKIGVFDWLNTNIVPPIHYIDWVKTIKVKKSHIQYLFTNNIVDTVVSIITSSITPATTIPFYAFGKTQTFYTFNQTNTWVIAEIITFTRLFKHVETELWKLLNEWKMQNSAEIYNNVAMNEKYQKTVSKLTDISYTPNDVYNKMKTKIYNAIKMDIKSIMEDEIEFN
jgi:hypothetical protein